MKGVVTMLRVTDTAREKLAGILKQENREDYYIRIYVNGVG